MHKSHKSPSTVVPIFKILTWPCGTSPKINFFLNNSKFGPEVHKIDPKNTPNKIASKSFLRSQDIPTDSCLGPVQNRVQICYL